MNILAKNADHEKPPEFSISGTLFWILFLSVGIQGILGLIVSVGVKALGVPNTEFVFMRPDIIAITGGIAAIVSFPLIKKAAYQSDNSLLFDFLALKSINETTLTKVLLAGFGYYLFGLVASYVFSIDTPQFMLDVKSQTNSTFDMLMLVLGVCIVAPIIEEIFFRGLAYARLVKSRVGVAGAIMITSLVFTVIHTQYDFTVLMILFLLAFLLGYVRYKTSNIFYCIALHMQINILSTIELFIL